MQLEYASNPVPLRMHLECFEHAQHIPTPECARMFGMHTEFSRNVQNALRLSTNAVGIFIATAFQLIPTLV